MLSTRNPVLSLALLLPVLPFFPLASAQQARCQYYPLRNAADLVLEALVYGGLDPSFVFSSNHTFLQNGKPTTPSSSVLSVPHKIGNDITLIDQEGCAIYAEVISADGQNKGVFGVQVRFGFQESEAGGVALQAERVDILAIEDGSSIDDTPVDAAKVLGHVTGETWEDIQQTQRTVREGLVSAAQTYVNWYVGEKGAEVLPVGQPCSRLEGSGYSIDMCSARPVAGKGGALVMADNSFVADEVLGGIHVWLERSNTLESFMFRVQEGKLRHIHHFVAPKGY